MREIKFLIYDLVFLFGFIIYLPVYFWRKKITFLSLKERLGCISWFSPNRSIWLQVVSVGEVNLIENLLTKIKDEYGCPIVISTTTLTGNLMARRKYSKLAKIIFFPLDISFVLRKAIKVINPRVFIGLETEIWPNLFYQLKRKNIPIVIINGRISDSAYQRYRWTNQALKSTINRCLYIGVQNEMYKKRFISLGADAEKLIISGNLKFESILPAKEKMLKIQKKYSSLFNLPLVETSLSTQLNISQQQEFVTTEVKNFNKNDKLILIAASTHHPEEEIIINIYKDLLKEFNNLKLVIAPRHLQRIESVMKVIALAEFKPIKISEATGDSTPENSVFVVDTLGELLSLFGVADICFVGGSLSPCGGHNILEPVYFSKPTLFGPYMNNFLDIKKIVLEKKAGIQVNNPAELKDSILRLLDDRKLRKSLAEGCVKVFQKEKKCLSKNLQLIRNSMGHS